MLKLHDLVPPSGSKKRAHRVGRGTSGRRGKTAGRGTKGVNARGTVPAWYEGGQSPLQQRLPKRKGFINPFRVEYQAVNLDTIERSGLTEVTPEILQSRGLVSRGVMSKGVMIKVLGRGTLSGPVTVRAHAFSTSARAAIETAGGTVELLQLAFKGPRPPARGNQHTNR